MRVLSEDGLSFIDLSYSEAELIRYPSIRLLVIVQNNGFSGSAQVWIDKNSFHSFIKSMEELDIKRNGEAHLIGMSPNVFELEFKTYDRSGHIIAVYSISKYLTHPERKISLSGAVLIDTSMFSEILRELKEIFLILFSSEEA